METSWVSNHISFFEPSVGSHILSLKFFFDDEIDRFTIDRSLSMSVHLPINTSRENRSSSLIFYVELHMSTTTKSVIPSNTDEIFIWLDRYFDEKNKEYRSTLKILRRLNDSISTYLHPNPCLDHLKSID